MFLVLCAFDFLCHMSPVYNIEQDISGWEEHHTRFIHQSNRSFRHVHTKGVAIDTEFQVGPEFTK